MEVDIKRIIWTKFYRSKLNQDSEIQSKNYTTYMIFSLKTWIHLWVKDWIGEDVFVRDNETPKEDNIYITISFILNDISVKLNDQQYNIVSKKIQDFDINKYFWFPIYSHRYLTNMEDGTVLPSIWVKQMINFIGVHPSYQAYICTDGLLINLSQNPDYIELAAQLTAAIKNKLVEMYKIGFVFKPSTELINNWRLLPNDIKGSNREYLSLDLFQSVDLNNNSLSTINYIESYDEIRDLPYDNLLYKAAWNDTRILGRYKYMTDFLISRMKGEKELLIKLDESIMMLGYLLLQRHLLTKELISKGINFEQFLYTDNGISIDVNNYEEARKIVNIISEYNINNKIDNNVELGFLKAADINEFKNIKEGLIYRTDDEERPYTASFIN